MKIKDNNNLRKKLGFLCRGVLLMVVVIFLTIAVMLAMTQKVPDGYVPPEPDTYDEVVSEYITHYLAPNVHNNIQLDKPFVVVVPQKGINEIIAEDQLLGWKWPVEFGKVVIFRPVAVFSPKTIRLMGKVDIAGFDTVITVCATPSVGKDGLLRLNLQYVRAGTLDISFLVKKTVKKIIEGQLHQVEEQYWLQDILFACQENKPFNPVFPTIYNRHIKLIKSRISENKVILVFEPSSRQDIADKPKAENGLYGSK